MAFELAGQGGGDEKDAALEFVKPVKLLLGGLAEETALMIDVADVFGFWVLGLGVVVLDSAIAVDE